MSTHYTVEMTFRIVVSIEADSPGEALEIARDDDELRGYALATAEPVEMEIIDTETHED